MKHYKNNLLKTVFVCFATISGCSSKATKEINFSEIKSNVFQLDTTVLKEGSKQGTCFSIGGNYFVTSHHLLEYSNDISNVKIHVKNNKDNLSYLSELCYEDSENDIAIIKCEKLDVSKGLSFSTSVLNIGDICYAYGSAYAGGVSLFKGVISNPEVKIWYNSQYNNFIETNIEIYPGCSGGCLINEDGKCIGMQLFRLVDNNGDAIKDLSYSISASKILSAIKECKKLLK